MYITLKRIDHAVIIYYAKQDKLQCYIYVHGLYLYL